jgi:hypothetical protein
MKLYFVTNLNTPPPLPNHTMLTPIRKALRKRDVKGLLGHKKVTQCLRSDNAAYVALTPRNIVGT